MGEPFLALGIGRLGDPQVHTDLLRSSVRVTRLAFGAAAASIFVYDSERDALVFEATSGKGEDRIHGIAIPADRGVAGWVYQTGETMLVHDVGREARFDREFAEATGYVPHAIAAAPLILDEPVGVLEVLDAPEGRFNTLDGMDLLTQLADHLAASVSLLLAARMMGRATRDRPGDEPWLRLEETLTRTRSRESTVVHRFVHALDDLLASYGGTNGRRT
jgi:signal transduction protein with GAF and PtsI domain